MKIAIVGCRPPSPLATDADHQLYRRIIADVEAFAQALPDGSTIISGGAAGVDRCAAMVASRRSLDLVEHLPQYEAYGRYDAPLRRNTLIVADADEVHAWPAPWSRGTRDTIRKGQRSGKPTHVHRLATPSPSQEKDDV